MSPNASNALRVRRFEIDHSVFFDHDYLIRGVAGSVLWRMLNLYSTEGRTEFTNRELRLDPQIPLPDIADNLEARLILLTRRLKDRSAAVQLEKRGRGRLRLHVDRPIELQSISAT
jgi:adenylate cyclase